MTNAQIVDNMKQRLLTEGKIKPTGRVLTAVDGEGNKIEIPEAEEIHTFQTWKELGYRVMKGQKAIAKFPIWKFTVKELKAEGEERKTSMFLKTAAWFSRSQVEKIEG